MNIFPELRQSQSHIIEWRYVHDNIEERIMKEVYDFLKKAKTYYLATVEGDQPRVRPFGTINFFEDKLDRKSVV